MFATIKKVVGQSFSLGWNIHKDGILLDYCKTLESAIDKRDEINGWTFGPLCRKMMREKYANSR